MFVRHPIWLRSVTRPGAESFALVFALESLSRSLISSVIPIQLLRILGDTQHVSAMYFGASCIGLVVSLFLPLLVEIVPRRWVYSIGAFLFVTAALLFMVDSEISLALGMLARVVGLVSTTICMNLYILDYIARKDLSKSEPKRVYYSALSWTVGPVCGALLFKWGGDWAPFAVSAVCAGVMLGYFWFLRLGKDTVILPAKSKKTKSKRAQNPLVMIGRYLKQPHLNTAWILAFCRAAWWSMFFIYTPLYAVESGLGEVVGGLIVSVGNACLFFLPLWVKIVRRIGARKTLIIAFFISGVGTSLVFFANGYALLGAGFILFAALGMSFQDAIGNLPFMAAVRPRERSEMTSVFSTYRDASELIPPGIFAILLRSFELSSVFLVTGGLMFVVAGFSRKLHPRLGKDRIKSQGLPEISSAAEKTI
ncbi:MFS transporter [Kiloniella sp.]|uniref:MFS transporter n=1 Tax=Kiloniella sp. TaxID=1938587 RepID=UPI003B024125